jgi:hypothetical protein
MGMLEKATCVMGLLVGIVWSRNLNLWALLILCLYSGRGLQNLRPRSAPLRPRGGGFE